MGQMAGKITPTVWHALSAPAPGEGLGVPVLPAGTVLLAAGEAAVFAPPVRAALQKAARDGFSVPNRLWLALEAMEQAATLSDRCRHNGAADNSNHDGDMGIATAGGAGSTRTTSEGLVSVAAAARFEGCTPQAITARIRRRTLVAELDDRGRYWLHPSNLKEK
jgi:hypothetical protein